MPAAARALKAVRWGLGAAALLAALLPAGLARLLGFRDAAMRAWCSLALGVVGLRARVTGPFPPPGSLVVMNHVGYLDILVVGARCPGTFVAKGEIARWPLAGWVARLGGTLFVERESARRSLAFVDEAARRLTRGENVLLFPEGGIVTGGRGVASFHPMFFEAAARTGRPVVPAAFRYVEPEDPRVWAWTDDGMFRHLFRRVLPAGPIVAELRFGPAIYAEGPEGRKELARRAHEAVRRLAGEPEAA